MNTSSQEKQRISSLLCANSCGFYGNPTTRNLCSKCYRNALLLEEKQKQLSASPQLSEKLLVNTRATNDTSTHLIASHNGANIFCRSESTPDNKHDLGSLESEEGRSQTSNDCLSETSLQPLPSVESCCPSVVHDYKIPTGISTKVIGSNSPINSEPGVDGDLNPSRNLHPDPSVINSSNQLAVLNEMNVHSNLDLLSEVNNSQIINNLTALKNSKESQDRNIQNNNADTLYKNEGNEFTQDPIQSNKTRCFKCNKKIGLLGFECRCSYYFCSTHRHADRHDCEFDYKAFGKRQLQKANQKIVADKLNRI